MDTIQSWSDALVGSLQNAWMQVAQYLPKLVGAIIILIFGWIIASFLGKLAEKLLDIFQFDELAKRTEVNRTVERIGIRHGLTGLIGKAVKWFFIFVTISAAIDVLDIEQLSILMSQFVLYLPNVLVAILIVLVGLMAAKAVYELIARTVPSSRIPDAAGMVMAAAAKWSIIVFAFMAALVQMRVAGDLIKILFAGIIVMLSLAGGLALGLGGRAKIERWLERFKI